MTLFPLDKSLIAKSASQRRRPAKSTIAARLLAGAAFAGTMAMPAFAQDGGASGEGSPDQGGTTPARSNTPPEAETQIGTGSGIVVEGRRLRGQLDVEQDPILELGEAEIAAEGVTSIADLITQITNQTGSNRGRGGGRPIILINGIRVGSFREFANYPPEALERLEVFPEEVAQRFGFAPDRRVINLILKDNYRNAEAEFEFEGPSRGGYHQREQEFGYLQIANGARINVNLEASDTSFLTEDERSIIQTPGSVSDVAGDPDQAPFRSLVGDTRSLEGNISWAKAIIDSGVSLSANANYARNDFRTLQGLNTVVLTDPVGESVLRTFGEETPLEQRGSTDTFSTSGSLTKPINAFRLTSTFNASLSETTQEFDRRFDTTDLIADALSGDLALDGDLPNALDGTADADFDTALTRTISASSLSTLRGPVAELPGGEVLATFDVGYNWTNLESSDTRNTVPVDLTRGSLTTGANLVVPITSRRTGFADALGSVTVNAQIGLEHLSDFGTLGDYTVGLNWKPFDKLDLSATYITRDVAPSLTSLGNPVVEFLNVPVFDFVNGETVLATVTTGGNPDLLAETQRDWKFAANWQLPFWDGARFTVEYVRNRSDDVTRGFPTVTADIEAAFPDRITRDASGTLTAIDRRFVTFAETRAERINFGLFFRGTIGAGDQSNQRGGRGGGRGRGGAARSGGGSPRAAQSGEGRPSGPPTREGGPPSAEQRAAFMEFRTRICADDGMDVLTRLIEANANGEDLSATIPGFDAQRFDRLLARVRADDGTVDPVRLARVRERICRFDPSADGAGSDAAGGRGARRTNGADGEARGPRGRQGPRNGPGGAVFAAFRTIACADDGVVRIKNLIARIDAGEDVSDELPGFDLAGGQRMIGRLRDADGNVSDERIVRMRGRLCSTENGGEGGTAQGSGTPAQSAGGPPPGFNPLARRSFPGFRYFVSANHTVELANEILIAPGLDPLDQLDGQATGVFGQPRHSSRVEAGIFGQGVGMRLSARYTGSTRLDGSAGANDIFFDDLATFDLRVFAEIGQLVGRDDGVLKNLRISLRADNVFDAQRRIVDANGDTPINYQPFLVDPVGRFIGVDVRKLF
ncbi:hypothetical protein [Erythrobacter sp. Alg231-14]|uniref:hypothetical protein n=1 Tax=Erythrobacter sp. Alg231-14 TaxID=1922225 RepID=UPI00307C3355